jgi:MerR family transcriptional regulator, redox-sensitive transcriptional activator SoxR
VRRLRFDHPVTGQVSRRPHTGDSEPRQHGAEVWLKVDLKRDETVKYLVHADGELLFDRRIARMTISEAAHQTGLQTSAIRYYEQIALLPAAERLNGQRRYDTSILYHLAIIQRARQLGFTLAEIRQLFFGFRGVTPASQRWRSLSQKKLAELDTLLHGIKAMQRLLRTMMEKCHCQTLDQCGKGIFQSGKFVVAGNVSSRLPSSALGKKTSRNV